MASGLLSSAERAALRDTLRSLEETGVAGAESQYTSLLKDIDEGATVTVGGKSYSIEEILNEKTVTQILTDYFNNPESPSSKLLAAEEPDLVTWANKNSAGIKDLIAKSAGASGELKGIQTQAKAAFGTLATLQPGLLNELTGIDLSKIQTSVPVKDLTKGLWSVPGKDGKAIVLTSSVQAIMNAPVNKQAQMSTSLASLSEVVGTAELKEYSPAQIEKLQLDKINGLWLTYSNAITEANKSENLTDPEGQLDAVAQGYDISDINEAVSDSSLYAALGYDTGNLTTFDSNKDGKFDSTEVATLYKGVSTTKPTLDGVANGTYKPPAKLTVQAPKLSAGQQGLAAAAQDGVISPDEAGKLSASMSTEELIKSRDSLMATGLPQYNNMARSLSTIISSRATSEVGAVLKTANISTDNLTLLVNTPPSTVTSWSGHSFESLPNTTPGRVGREAIILIRDLTARNTKIDTVIAQVKEAAKNATIPAAKRELEDKVTQLETQKTTTNGIIDKINAKYPKEIAKWSTDFIPKGPSGR
jgi:hypothetical protein